MAADIPEFEMTLTADGRVAFVHGPQARAYLRRLFVQAGGQIVGQFHEYRAKRSQRQNRAAHALIANWIALSESLRGQSIEHVKQWLLARVFGWHEIVDVESGEVIKVLAEPHTSKLSVGQFCEYIEAILELAAGDGVVLLAPEEFTKLKDSARRRAERKAARAA